MKKTALVALLAGSATSWLFASAGPQPRTAPPGEARVVRAVKTAAPIVLDGRLDEAVWQGEACDGFTQNEPEDGSPATERTQAWVAYDDKAVYVAAFCHDSEPGRVLGRLGRRDARVESDWFVFAVDPYFDRRTGYLFGVNPAGSIQDVALSNDVSEDSSWDGIWEAATHVNGDGWIVEMRIPFDQLRFPEKEEHVWGVNFRRTVKRKNETSSFSWVPRNETAFVSRFARLEGLQGIRAGRHLEILPYVVSQARIRPAEPGNPFETGHRVLGDLGFDLKAGLKGNLTLDATVNPDFGQVEVDPAVLNLSAYETYYQEKRPFFIEGAALFSGFGRGGIHVDADVDWPNPRLFYSRRIGREPQGGVTADGFARMPDRTSILGAAKLTGRLSGGWNFGLIGAATARESALIDRGGVRSREEVEPFSTYSVARLQKDIQEGRRGFGLLATSVVRDLRTGTLSGILNRNAFALAADGWSSLDAKRQWVIGGWFGGTRVEGTPEQIRRLQTSSIHYFQRPDADHVEVDPAARSLSGWGGRISLVKQGGNAILLSAIGVLSPGFNPNDAGFQSGRSDLVNIQVLPGYVWSKPGRVFLYSIAALGAYRNRDFAGNRIGEGLLGLWEGQFRNFWNYHLVAIVTPDTLSPTLTRGGPLAVNPGGIMSEMRLSTDGRKPIVLEGSGSFSRQPKSGTGWSGQLTLRWKPRANLSLSIGPTFGAETNEIQWVTRVADPAMTSTYGHRYVFGRLDQNILASDIRFDWTFTPRLTLQAYLQPFLAVGRYDRFKELARPRAFAYNVYGENGSTIASAAGRCAVDPDGAGPAAAFSFGNPDFNVKSLRGTIVLRWEYRPGSLLYFVWTQNRADEAHPGELRLGRDLGDLFTAPGDNILLLKFSYRWAL